MNIQEIIKEYNAACEKHNCFLGDIEHHETYDDTIIMNSEFYGIGVTKEDGRYFYRGYVKDMDQLFHNAFVDEDKSIFFSMEEVVAAMQKEFDI